MTSTRTLTMTAAAFLWAAVVALAAGTAAGDLVQKTTNDPLYTKAQADGAQALYTKVCLNCHPFSSAAKKQPKDLPLAGDEFFELWEGRTIRELVNIIVLTMPNDGSAVLNDQEAADLVAYILQQNGFPAGKTPLGKAEGPAVLERPKK